ncbi:hypothetical protein KSP40_PGU012022 [Platanthera guangdongensis]|uniref:Uncharacterized protein n=1 Tax=Platanthera guangdongensis TaxID=2320717 RepID=A0ABR2MPN3_9ASPA
MKKTVGETGKIPTWSEAFWWSPSAGLPTLSPVVGEDGAIDWNAKKSELSGGETRGTIAIDWEGRGTIGGKEGMSAPTILFFHNGAKDSEIVGADLQKLKGQTISPSCRQERAIRDDTATTADASLFAAVDTAAAAAVDTTANAYRTAYVDHVLMQEIDIQKTLFSIDGYELNSSSIDGYDDEDLDLHQTPPIFDRPDETMLKRGHAKLDMYQTPRNFERRDEAKTKNDSKKLCVHQTPQNFETPNEANMNEWLARIWIFVDKFLRHLTRQRRRMGAKIASQ